MILEQVYILFIYILVAELGILTVVVVALLAIILVFTSREDKNKNTSLLGR